MLQNRLTDRGLFFGDRCIGCVRPGRSRRIFPSGGTHRNTIQPQHSANVVDVFRGFHIPCAHHVAGNRIPPWDHKNIFVFDLIGGQNQRHFRR